MKNSHFIFYTIFVVILIVFGKIAYSEYQAFKQRELEIAETQVTTQQSIAESKAFRDKNQAQIDKLYNEAKEASQSANYSIPNKDIYSDYEYILVGGGHSGYFINKKKGAMCAEVTGLTDLDLKVLGKSLRELKKDVKQQTGEKCVLFVE